MDLYNILVWADDAGTFVKEWEANQKLLPSIKEIWIFGNEIRIEDLKALNVIQNTGVAVVINENVFLDKKDSELFILGRYIAERDNSSNSANLGMITYSPVDKTVSEAAKKLNATVISWTNFLALPKKRMNAKQQNKNTTKTVAKVQNESKRNKASVNKKEASREPDKPILQSSLKKVTHSQTTADIKKILKSAKLSQYITDEYLPNIIRAVQEASDPNIGLPMLLKLYCGLSQDICNEIASKLAPYFNELKGK